MFILELLGTPSLRGDTRPVPLAAQQKRPLGLLAVLGLAGRHGLSRDRIEAYLWPDSSAALARHALDQAVYTIRHAIVSDFILSMRGELRLNPELVQTDVWEFEEAIRARQWALAVGHYKGPLLDGFHFTDNRELESWIDIERARLLVEYQTALEHLAKLSAEAGDHSQSVTWWRRLASSDPLSAVATRKLMLALAAAGDRAGAVKHARLYQELVRQALEIEPDSEVERLASSLSHHPIAETVDTPARPRTPTVLALPASSHGKALSALSEIFLMRRWGRRRARIATSIVAALLVTVAILAVARRKTPSASAFPGNRAAHASGSANPDASASSAIGPITAVAVIPFSNTGGNPQDEYFSDGMTDELAHALSLLPRLRVAGRSSSYAFKGKSISAQEICKTLNVSAVVEGSVRRAGHRLRVIAQLTSAKNGQVMWSDAFESSENNVFQLQDDFTTAIIGALAPALGVTAASFAASTSRGTDDPEAYDLYLKGRYFFARRGASGLRRAIAYFTEAAAKDPKFARARAGMSMAYGVLGFYETSDSTGGKAKIPEQYWLALALKNGQIAEALDSSLGDAHLALANALTNSTRLKDADVEYQRALTLQPEDPTTHEWYGANLTDLGRVEEGLAEERRAEALDPLSPVIAVEVSMALFADRRFQEAVAWSQRAIELDSTLTLAQQYMGIEYVFGGQAEKGVQVLERSFARDPGQFGSRGNMILAYAAGGRWDDVRRLYDDLTRKSAQVADLDLLDAYVAVGDREKALKVFEHWTQQGIPDLAPGCDPSLDPLHGDARFLAVIRRFGAGLCPVTTAWPIEPLPSDFVVKH